MGAVGGSFAWAPVGGTPDLWVSLSSSSKCQTKLQPDDGTPDGTSFTNRVEEESQKGHVYCCQSSAGSTVGSTGPFPPVSTKLTISIDVAPDVPAPTLGSLDVTSETVTLKWSDPIVTLSGESNKYIFFFFLFSFLL